MLFERKYAVRMASLAAMLVVCAVISLGLGRYPVDPAAVCRILISRIRFPGSGIADQAEFVVLNIRLPRVVMSCVIGAGLSCAGCAYQGIFRNPMASPEILGAGSGAGLGAAIGLILGLGYRETTLLAFAGGLCAVAIVLLVSLRARGSQTLGLILSGVMVGSLFSAGISYIKLIADPTNTLPAITYWLMGSLASIRDRDMLFAAPMILLGIAALVLLRFRIGVLSMGDEEAATMGVHAKRLRTFVVLCATLITAACVSVSGMIGWVGLAVPHLSRALLGGDFRRSLPGSLLLGAVFLMIADNIARLAAKSEIPLGILTAFAGAPFILSLLRGGGNREPMR